MTLRWAFAMGFHIEGIIWSRQSALLCVRRCEGQQCKDAWASLGESQEQRRGRREGTGQTATRRHKALGTGAGSRDKALANPA